MAKLNAAPTKSNLLTLKRQLAFAEEGYDLLEQKRQILVSELMKRLARVRQIHTAVEDVLHRAHEALTEAQLDIGTDAIDRASLGVHAQHEVKLSIQHLMGMKIFRIVVQSSAASAQFGVGGTSANTDIAMSRFVEALPLLGELAEIENAVLRLSSELRKTQRRCNALSKIFMPTYRETIGYIIGTLEERERESFVILKMIRNRLTRRTDEDS
jgi:V/A-type H+/Na+-transporting ATPase subunit D